jgi:hypothetical protein
VNAENLFIVLVVILAILGTYIYFIPTFIARSRGHKNTLAIFALNLLLGWSLIGWTAALVWAMLADQETRRRKYARSEPTPFDSSPPSPPPPQATFIYTCPHCRRPVNVAANFLGHAVVCGSCGQHFTATPTAPPAS